MSTTQPESLMMFSLPRKRKFIPMNFAIIFRHLAGILKNFILFYLYFNIVQKFDFTRKSISGAYSAFFQLRIRNSMNGIHKLAANALAITKKMNFARYLTLSLKAHSITKRNNIAIALVE